MSSNWSEDMVHVPQKYKKAKPLPLEKALGLDAAEIEEKHNELLAGFDLTDFLDGYRESVEILGEVNRHLDEYIVKYERDHSKREEVERVYALKIDVLYSMARRFHPLSTFGKQKLDDAVMCRREFETLVGPLISRITENNVDIFASVLTAELMDDIKFGRRQAIGAIRSVEGDSFAAAALVYHFDKEFLRVDWLYVEEDFRGRSIAHFLIGELIGKMVRTGRKYLSFCFDATGAYRRTFGYILAAWQFDFGNAISPETIIKVGDVSNFDRISKYKAGVKLLSTVGKAEQKQLIANTLRRCGYRGYLLKVPEDYIDDEVSCFTGTVTSPTGLLLTHRTPDGDLRVVFSTVTDDRRENIARMHCRFLEQAVKTNGANTLLYIDTKDKDLILFLGAICPKQLADQQVRGILKSPPEDADFDDDDIETMLSASAEEIEGVNRIIKSM